MVAKSDNERVFFIRSLGSTLSKMGKLLAGLEGGRD